MSRIKRFRPFQSNFVMNLTTLDGYSEFTMKGGNLTVICNSVWDSHSPGFNDFTITPKNTRHLLLDGETKTFQVGVDVKIWTDLDVGDYYFRIRVRPHEPHALKGMIMVS